MTIDKLTKQIGRDSNLSAREERLYNTMHVLAQDADIKAILSKNGPVSIAHRYISYSQQFFGTVRGEVIGGRWRDGYDEYIKHFQLFLTNTGFYGLATVTSSDYHYGNYYNQLEKLRFDGSRYSYNIKELPKLSKYVGELLPNLTSDTLISKVVKRVKKENKELDHTLAKENKELDRALKRLMTVMQPG